MSFPVKGSVIVADGNGKVSVVSPTSDSEVLMLDSANAKGARFVNIANLIPKQSQKISVTNQKSVSSTSYLKLVTTTVPGESTKPITDIKVFSYKTGNASSYSVRVFDATNNLVVAETTFSNSNGLLQSLGSLSNLPSSEATFEIQLRKDNGNSQSEAIVEEVEIVY